MRDETSSICEILSASTRITWRGGIQCGRLSREGVPVTQALKPWPHSERGNWLSRELPNSSPCACSRIGVNSLQTIKHQMQCDSSKAGQYSLCRTIRKVNPMLFGSSVLEMPPKSWKTGRPHLRRLRIQGIKIQGKYR